MLNSNGGTHIYSGLEKCLEIYQNEYSSGDRITFMILF